jgi:hypothetical protein
MPLTQAIGGESAASPPGRTALRTRSSNLAASVTIMSTGAADLARIRTEVGAALDKFIARQRHELAGIAAELLPCADAIADLVAGGKRLRAAFC